MLKLFHNGANIQNRPTLTFVKKNFGKKRFLIKKAASKYIFAYQEHA